MSGYTLCRQASSQRQLLAVAVALALLHAVYRVRLSEPAASAAHLEANVAALQSQLAVLEGELGRMKRSQLSSEQQADTTTTPKRTIAVATAADRVTMAASTVTPITMAGAGTKNEADLIARHTNLLKLAGGGARDRVDRLARVLKAKILVKFSWNSGRLGNQIRSLAYAVGMADMLGGSVVIPTPVNSSKRLSSIGLEPDPTRVGLFDVKRLLGGLPVAFASEIGVEDAMAARKACKFGVLYGRLRGGRRYNDYAFEPRGPELVALVKELGCTLLDLEGELATLPPFSAPICAWFQRDLDRQLLYRHLVPASWVQEAVATRLAQVQWARPFVGMHFRNHAQSMSRNLSVCVEGAKYHLEHATYPPAKAALLANVSCTMHPESIAKAWRMFGLSHDFSAMRGHWLLASDRTDCTKAFVNDVRVFHKKVCPARWRLKEEHRATWVNISAIELPNDTWHTSFSRYAEAVAEMWAMTQADFFFGTFKSSLSDMVCGWREARGPGLVNKSSTCWAMDRNDIIPGPKAVSGCGDAPKSM